MDALPVSPIKIHYRPDRSVVIEIREVPGQIRFLLTEKAINGEAWNRGLTRDQFLQLAAKA